MLDTCDLTLRETEPAKALGNERILPSYLRHIKALIIVLDSQLTMKVILFILFFMVRVVEKYFDDLKPLTVVDPLFLPMFVAACPLPELPLLFHQVPPYVSVSRTSVLIGDTIGSLTKNEVSMIKYGLLSISGRY